MDCEADPLAVRQDENIGGNIMRENLLSWKASIVAFFTIVSEILGWRGIMLFVWVIVMCLDYFSGTFAACKNGEWDSAKARQGLWHKGGMILVVMVAGITDLIMVVICQNLDLGVVWQGILMPLILAWYIITELGSILENAVKLGAEVPTWLTRMLKHGLKAVDKLGEGSSGDEESKKE